MLNSDFFCLMSCNFSRPKWAGGQYEGDEHKRLEALNIAEELSADYVDFELQVVY